MNVFLFTIFSIFSFLPLSINPSIELMKSWFDLRINKGNEYSFELISLKLWVLYLYINKGKVRNVKLQAKIKNNQDKTSDILQGDILVLNRFLHCQKAQQVTNLVGRSLKQIPHAMQEHQVQIHSQNQVNYQVGKLILLCNGEFLNQPHWSY